MFYLDFILQFRWVRSLARWFSLEKVCTFYSSRIWLDLGFDSRAGQHSISFNSRELFGGFNGELQGENNENQCTNYEEETVVGGRTGGLMGKPGTRISDPRFIHDMSLYFHDIVSFEPISCHFREDRKCKLFPEKTIGCVLLDGFLRKKFALSIFALRAKH